jgi:hypothetical protein
MPEFYTKDGDNYVLYSGAKLVPETDLVTVKGGLESKVKEMESQLADAKGYADQNLNRALKAESDLTTIKSEVEPLRAKAAEVDTLNTKLVELTAGRTELETKVLGQRRTELVSKFKMPEDKAKELDSMTMEQLDSIEQTLEKFGVVPQSDPNPNPNGNGLRRAAFDVGGGGGGGTNDSPRGRDLIKQGLREGSASGTTN